jgi:glycosyltransferase involved in cell wall biosynthesis
MSQSDRRAEHIALFAYYFPPLSSSGAKRMEAMAKYFARAGRRVTVITQTKSHRDGLLSELAPPGVTVLELNKWGRLRPSPAASKDGDVIQRAESAPGLLRRIKNLVLRVTGQLIDPRMPFPIAMWYPWLDPELCRVLETVDVVVGTCPPWPPLLAALNAGARFEIPVVLDYRDQLSCCHEMPGSRIAKRLEISLDGFLTRRATAVVAISEPLRDYYSRFHKDSFCILNGYDKERLDAAKARQPWASRKSGEPIRIRYMGLITEGRLPHNLLDAMEALFTAGHLPVDSVDVEFYGNCELMKQLVTKKYPKLRSFFHFFAAVPYDRALELIVSADHLLFCEQMIPALPGQEESAAGILPTKLYEYLASGRPVLANVPPDTLAGQFIRGASPKHIASRNTSEFIAHLRSDAFRNPAPVPTSKFVRTLSREVQAQRYLALLDRVAAESKVKSFGI